MSDWLEIRHGAAPLLMSFPHTGTDLPAGMERGFVSPWLAQRDSDWWIDRLYDFAADLDATIVRTTISRSVIDVNRDPSGASLYPGQATTDLCPTTTFDGAPLYRNGCEPDGEEITRRRALWFDPYHQAIEAELTRLRALHPRVVLYDAHSIRSRIPRLFEGELPQFNIGTFSGASCDPALAAAVQTECAASGMGHVLDGRFKGGWTTRHYSRPTDGVHAIQMELAMRGYMDEPDRPSPGNWPAPFDPDAAPVRPVLIRILEACLAFAEKDPA